MTLFPGVAIITGGASGIGRQVAISFAREGCTKIAIIDRNADGLAETRALILALNVTPTPEVDIQEVDVTSEESIVTTMSKIVAKFGRIDYAVNAAGVTHNGKRTTDISTDHFDGLNSINYRGVWLCGRAELSQMLTQEPLPTHDGRPGNRGSIVHVASQLGLVGRPNAPLYCASKGAIIALTRCDAIDYSKDNIRVNCVCPGIIATPMTQSSPEKTKSVEPSLAMAPLNRWGTTQEVADAVLFLASSKSTFSQGSAMLVDGGYTAN